MGVKGFKVDFFDRDDQRVIRSTYELAACAARHHLLLDLHGLKPFGVQRAYPNIMNFEGIKGLENCKWEARTQQGPVHDFPRYDVTAPYLRMLPGPMDYTPGAMVNANKDAFFGNNGNPMSQGTRCHQLALYIVLESPLNMLCDSPTHYEREPDYTRFVASIPTVWDETRVLQGEVGEYIVTARRKGNTWYIGGITNWTERDLEIDFEELQSDSATQPLSYSVTLYTDGINAHRKGSDYKLSTFHSPLSTLKVHLALGGGFVLTLCASE
jgi:alpha-glucosidase